MDLAGTIQLVICRTDNITEKVFEDFLSVQHEVFGFKQRCRYERQFMSNIYGSSVIVLAYVCGDPAGARAFWRNDLAGNRAFQPGSTAVRKDYRGQGVFRIMTQAAIDAIGQDTMIYNFPNDQSLPGYLKMGWTIREKRRYRFVTLNDDLCEVVDDINDSYLAWVLGNDRCKNADIRYTQYKGKYLLLKKRKLNLYVVIGKLRGNSTPVCKKAVLPILIVYSKHGYFGRGIVTVAKNVPNEINIPIYKMDTLF